MRIAFVSTFPPTPCGIASYTRMLCEGMLQNDRGVAPEIVVLARQGAKPAAAPWVCEPCFSFPGAAGDRIVECAERHGVDVCHFQHAPDILGIGKPLLRVIDELKERGIRSVITLHTVFDFWSALLERRLAALSFYRALGARCEAIVIHHERPMRRFLLNAGVPNDKIEVIPHGTAVRWGGDPESGRRLLGLSASDEPILVFGFIRVQKNIQVVVKAMPLILRERPRARLVVAGNVAGPAWYNKAYLRYLRRLVRVRGLEDKVLISTEFVPEDRVPDVFSMARVVLLPHAQGYGSASGVVHLALGMGRPILCSKSAKFAEVADRISPSLLVPTFSPNAWAREVVRFLSDQERVAVIQDKMAEYAGATSWPNAAGAHRALYEKVLD